MNNKKIVALAVNTKTNRCSVISSIATFSQLKSNFDLYAKQFDGYNWGGCDDINDILRRINLKPTGNKFNYKGTEYGSDSDHGHSYSWEFEYDEIWEVA